MGLPIGCRILLVLQVAAAGTAWAAYDLTISVSKTSGITTTVSGGLTTYRSGAASANLNVATLLGGLATSDVQVETGGSGVQDGNILVQDSLAGIVPAGRTLTFLAVNDVAVNAPITAANISLVVTAPGSVSLSAALNVADLAIQAGGPLSLQASCVAAGGIHLTAAGASEGASGSLTAGTGLSLAGTGSFDLRQAANAVGTLQAAVTGSLFYRDAQALAISPGITTGGFDVTVTSLATLTVNGPVSTTPGSGGAVSTNGSTVVNAALTPGTGNITLLGSTMPVELMLFEVE